MLRALTTSVPRKVSGAASSPLLLEAGEAVVVVATAVAA